MKKKCYNIVITESMLSQFSVTAMVEKEGACGLGMFLETCRYLKMCYHAIGMLNDIPGIAKLLRKTPEKYKEWLLKYKIFNVDESKGTFVYKTFRRMFRLSDCVSERESDVVAIYGNKINKEPEEYTVLHPVENVSEGDSVDRSLIDCSAYVERSSNVRSSSVERKNAQISDNKVVDDFHSNSKSISKGIGIIRKGNNTTIPTTTSTVSDVDSSAAAGAEEESFNFLEKKLISCTEWRKSTSNTRGINLEDDKILHFFAEWMRDYCISNNSMPRDENEILHYASSLLTKGLRTRKCFDEAYRRDFLHESPSAGGSKSKKGAEEKPVYAPMKHSGSFEQLINGRRVGLDGQILPPHAPRLHNVNHRWSYRKNCYVDVSEWDRDAEEKARKEWEKKEREKEHARKMKFLDECSRKMECGEHGIKLVGDIIKNNILPGMKPLNKA